MNKIQEKIKKYLHKEFPGKILIQSSKVVGSNRNPIETYGFMTIQLDTVSEGDVVYYQVIYNNK